MSEPSDNRYKMSLLTFLFFSIAGGGFVLKGVVAQYTDWGYNSWILYAVASILYAIPYTFMIIELSSIKKLKDSESGYQTWLNLILGKKYGFIAGFFYFYVNIFYFVDLLPNIITYFLYTVNSDVTWVTNLTNQMWFKPIISIASIVLFWIATWVSIKGPELLSKLLSFAGYAGFALTLIFIVAALYQVSFGYITYDGKAIVPQWMSTIDLSWSKIASMSWALQSLGGLEALAAYKRNIKGGERSFRLGLTLNVFIFSGIMMLSAIMMNMLLPDHAASELGLLSAIYVTFQQLGFPEWWTNVIAAFLLLTTLCGSLMLWTAAPVKMLFVDAPKGIFGDKMSEVNREGTPVNALKMQGVLVTVVMILFMVGQFSSDINEILIAVKNLNGGAATLPVLFMLMGYMKLRMDNKNENFERDFHFLGKGRFWALLAVAPMAIIFIASTVAALVPGPELWQANFQGSLIQMILGPLSIVGAFVYCEYAFSKWRAKNPNDHSLFNKV